MELGEPYKDNHCDHLEAEIDLVTRELEAAAKKLRELSTLKEQLLPELERLKVGARQCCPPPSRAHANSHSVRSVGLGFMPRFDQGTGVLFLSKVCLLQDRERVMNGDARDRLHTWRTSLASWLPARYIRDNAVYSSLQLFTSLTSVSRSANQASLAVDLSRRRKIQREAARAARAARAGGETNRKQAASASRPGAKPVAISSRSFQAMQSRALRLFRRSVSRFQALTEDDFTRVADLSLLPESADEGVEDRGGDVGGSDAGGDIADHNGVGKEQARNPTPSLSAASSTSSASSSRRPSGGSSKDEAGGSSEGVEHRPEETGEGGVQKGEKETESRPSSSVAAVPAAAAILRLLRATVLVLGGLGLGALPSDKELWDAVRPMLSDGSLRHRLRHFDR